MSKDTKEIIGSVRIDGTVFRAGQEDELAAVLDAGQVERLTSAGVIAGFGAKPKAVASEKPAEEAKTASKASAEEKSK